VAERVHDSIVVKADPDAIMDVIADFEAYPEWQDEIRKVEILETDEDGWATKAHFEVDAKIMSMAYTLAYTYADTAMRWTLVDSEQVRAIDGAYLLEDQGDGTTKVTYELEIDPKISIPGVLKRKAARRIVDGALNAMKRRVEQG
jgi:ribosome-associated toxin RatA of RatAB toxin-antitoxin module